MQMLETWEKVRRMPVRLLLLALVNLALLPFASRAQSYSWSIEPIDDAGGDTSITVDKDGNLHVAYYHADGGELRYAFRSSNDPHWYKMTLDHSLGIFSTQIATDSSGDPHICYSPRALKYAHFDGKKWSIQEVDKNGGLISYTCSIKIDTQDAPHIVWYVESGVFLRYADLKDGAWMAHTLDYEGLPGKWNSLALDDKGYAHIAYIDFPAGQLRYVAYDGKAWARTIIDGPGTPPNELAERGFGVSLIFDTNKVPWISYYDEQSLKLARFIDNKWQREIVEALPSFGHWAWKNFRSSIVFDSKGTPHIGFESLRGLEHAWWDGKTWQIQLLLKTRGDGFFDNCMTIDKNDNLFISYKDPGDGSVKLLVGRPEQSQQAAKAEKDKAGK
jgi:hypothetical protein